MDVVSGSSGTTNPFYVDWIDIVADHLSSSDYKEEEDPRVYKSKRTGRGPLGDKWRENDMVMCIYKLCKGSFGLCVCVVLMCVCLYVCNGCVHCQICYVACTQYLIVTSMRTLEATLSH